MLHCSSGVASSITGGDIFIYSCSAQLISFEIMSISKEINCAEQEYMNMSPSLIELATPLTLLTVHPRRSRRKNSIIGLVNDTIVELEVFAVVKGVCFSFARLIHLK